MYSVATVAVKKIPAPSLEYVRKRTIFAPATVRRRDDDRQFSLCCGFIIGSGELIDFDRLEDDRVVAGL